MPEERNKPHGLILFNATFAEESEEEKLTYEDVDQENAIHLLSEISPFGSTYRYSILLANNSAAPITDVKTKIKYPDFLFFARHSPPTIEIKSTSVGTEKGTRLINLEFFELPENSKKQINLFFTPKSLNHSGELATFVTFVNAKDFVRVLNSNPLEISVKPITIEPKIIPSKHIQGFLKQEGVKKAVKSLGVGIDGEVNFDLIFNHMEQLLVVHKFQTIAKDGAHKIIWAFGTELESKQDILMIGQVVENKIEFLGASMNHSVMIPLLTNFIDDFKKRLLSMTIISKMEQVHELDCKYCGMVLPRFPAKGEAIECKQCQNENKLW